MTLFKQKYRIESTRLRGWDYSAAGYYFVTFCTGGREPCLGQVVDSDVRLSPFGEIVAEEWLRTETIRPNIRLDEWLIMPNHVHGIIVITYPVFAGGEMGDGDTHGKGETGDGRTPETGDGRMSETGRRPVSTDNIHPNSLGSIVGQIKSISAKRIRLTGKPDFHWQERFYDRIIRDEEALLKARAYIIGNPSKWLHDKDNVAGVFM